MKAPGKTIRFKTHLLT